ncbi:LrgB family protein [Lactococcus kimchii]|uniref:LrgB family protein n=1 Tax=Lactococcus sp. S-13 TaxID=2507158 RepID=UPI0010235D77|nr:LrgB family protein [Lactococcus sp. S-13]RZI48582.1 LrgB family protein [Lactococcus sp. S-13]
MFNQLTADPLFGLVLTILTFMVGVRINENIRKPYTNPLLFATLAIIIILLLFHIPYKNYYVGGSIINDLIGPSTVALGIPLYKTFHLMKHHARSIVSSIAVAALLNTILTALCAKFFGLSKLASLSIFPKSVTTAMAMGISDKMHGVEQITVVVVVATGILTSVLGRPLLKLFKINDPVAQGIALGGTGHAVGTGTAIELGKTQGAMAALSIGVTGIMYVIFAPLVAHLILGY